MKHKQHYMIPVIAGGVLAAILSVIPVVNYCNLIFCMWMLLGAGLAVYLVKQKAGEDLEPKEGAIIGVLTGAITGGLFAVLYLLIFLLFGAAMIPGIADGGQHGEDAAMGIGMFALIFIGSAITALLVYSLFGALGGLLASLIFKNPQQGPPPGQYPPGGPPPGGGGYLPPDQGFGPPPQGFGQPPGGGGGYPPPGQF